MIGLYGVPNGLAVMADVDPIIVGAQKLIHALSECIVEASHKPGLLSHASFEIGNAIDILSKVYYVQTTEGDTSHTFSKYISEAYYKIKNVLNDVEELDKNNPGELDPEQTDILSRLRTAKKEIDIIIKNHSTDTA